MQWSILRTGSSGVSSSISMDQDSVCCVSFAFQRIREAVSSLANATHPFRQKFPQRYTSTVQLIRVSGLRRVTGAVMGSFKHFVHLSYHACEVGR